MVDLVIEFTKDLTDWQAYVEHLTRVKMLSSATNQGEPKENCFYLGIAIADQVIGHLTFRQQPLVVPCSSLTDGHEMVMTDRYETPLDEIFVQSFAVEAGYRRQGYGRALQQRALRKAHELGCYQMRSWSSADKRENYALKIDLGFAVQPALYPMPGGTPISGVYFVKRIET